MEVQTRREGHADWFTRIVVFLFVCAVVFPQVIGIYEKNNAEFEAKVMVMQQKLPELISQVETLEKRIEKMSVYSTEEYIRDIRITLGFREDFGTLSSFHLPTRFDEDFFQNLIDKLNEKFCLWAEEYDVDFQRQLALNRSQIYKRDLTMEEKENVFSRTLCFNGAMHGGLCGINRNVDVGNEFVRAWMGAGKLYLYFIPFGLLLLLASIYRFGRSFKTQIIFGWKKLIPSLLMFKFRDFGSADYFGQRIHTIRWKLYPNCWNLTLEQEAEVVRVAMEPVKKVDKRLAQGRLAFLCTTILMFLSLPVFGQAKGGGGEKRGKANVTQVDSTIAKTAPVVINPPKVSGQIRGNFFDKTGEFALSNAIVTAEGAADGVGWKIEYDGNKKFLRCAQISAKIRRIAIRAGTMMTNWLYSNQAPHSHAVIEGTPLAGHIPLFGSGAEAEFKRGRFLSSLAYVGDGGLIGRIQYGTSALKGNVVGFFQDEKENSELPLTGPLLGLKLI